MTLLTKIPVLAVAVTMVVQEAAAARILMLQPVCSSSHKNYFMAIADNLTQRNHTVTLVTGCKAPRPGPNIREVFVSNIDLLNFVPNLFNTSNSQFFWHIIPYMVTACSQSLADDGVQSVLKEEFDLVMLLISSTECFLSYIHERKVPFIYIWPNALQSAHNELAGSPNFPSLTANFNLALEYPLTFSGRLASTLYDVVMIVMKNFVLAMQEAECRARKLCPEDMPSIMEIIRNNSLLITNSIGTMENPTRPYTPTVVHAGGIHCRPAEPLPKDLQQWVAGAGKPGVILLSLGSLVKSSTMPEEYKEVLLKVFGSLQQRILWKWDEDTIQGLPSNVRLSKWLPQQDILGHPQLRLFITHGGLFSTQEATYHGVPVLGMPLGIDQHSNLRAAQREGWARVLLWQDLTYDSLRSHILEAMDDSSLKAKVQQRSRVMRDQPVSPGDWVTYWVEYVLRHQGARHLRCPALDMPWYQLYNADVWAVVVVVTALVVGLASWVSYRILRALLGYCCRSTKTKKD